MTGLPNVVGDRAPGPKTVDQWFNIGGVPAGDVGHVRQRAAQPADRARVPELRYDAAAPDQLRAARVAPRCGGTSSIVFNTTNFGLPNKDITTPPTFGTISSLASDPRTMQLAVRLTF